MSAIAQWFPGNEALVYCAHCKKNINSSTQNKHMKKYLAATDGQTTSDNDLGLNAGNSNDDNNMDIYKESPQEALESGSPDELGGLEYEAQTTEPYMNHIGENAWAWDLEDPEGMRGPEQPQINNTVGYHTYESDGDRSNRSNYSHGSWYHVPTPPPSPLSSPPPNHDNNKPSEDEDGFQNINTVDFCVYECWHTDPNTGEDVDMHKSLSEIFWHLNTNRLPVAETLTDKEVDSIIMLAIRQFGIFTQSDFEQLQYSFQHKLRLLTSYHLQTRIAKLSGIKPVDTNCCIKISHTFTGKYAKETYLPASPRFRALFNNPDLIRKMLYRHKFKRRPGRMDDFFDSQIYKHLLETNIVIDGIDTGIQHFPGKHNIAIAVMSNGVNIFDRGSKETNTCWPIMAQNLNLPQAEHAQMRNLILLGVIPGLNKPKDFNSFLHPFVKECIKLTKGTKTYNVITGQTFTLHVHPVIISGNMQAIKYLQNFKGPNTRVPCCGCLMVGVYHAAKKTYYIPLAEPLPANGSSSNVSSYNPHNLPLCTDRKTVNQTKKIEGSSTSPLAEEFCKKFGICGPSILDCIPSIQRPSSYPHEFMHLFLLNQGPALVSLWIGTHPRIPNAGSGYYLLSHAVWIAIGAETEGATYLLPANDLFGHSQALRQACISITPNLGPSGSSTLVLWCYELVCILKCLLNLENTKQRIAELKEEIIEYVERFEEYYYQYNYDCLSVCWLTLHALLHVADDVLRCGPVWVAWSFSNERYCREIVGCTKLKVVPYPTINWHVLQMAHLAAVACRFLVIRKAMLFRKSQAPVQSSTMEKIYADYPETILRLPHLPGFPLNDHVRHRIAQYLHTNFPCWTFHSWLAFVPDHAKRWGKLQIPNGGDHIRCAAVVDPLSPYGKGDSTFIQYKFQKDANKNFRHLPCDMVDTFGYGRLDFVIALVLPPSEKFKLKEPKLHILAHIMEAKGAIGDVRTEFVSFSKFGRPIILDITSVQRVVGRVFTKGVKQSGEWYIINRSLDISETAFHPANHAHHNKD